MCVLISTYSAVDIFISRTSTSTVTSTVSTGPKLPSQITGKTVEEVSYMCSQNIPMTLLPYYPFKPGQLYWLSSTQLLSFVICVLLFPFNIGNFSYQELAFATADNQRVEF